MTTQWTANEWTIAQVPIKTVIHNYLLTYWNVFAENIYDQIPNEQFYDAPYEMRTNDEVYEPEPVSNNVITINGISVR